MINVTITKASRWLIAVLQSTKIYFMFNFQYNTSDKVGYNYPAVYSVLPEVFHAPIWKFKCISQIKQFNYHHEQHLPTALE